MKHDRVADAEVFLFSAPRNEPYLGPLAADESPTRGGLVVRRGNKTAYPTDNRSVVVRLRAESGAEGWGETYGLAAAGAVAAIVHELLADFLLGRDPHEAPAAHDEWRDLMRVRGHSSGFYTDALAALDVALWDLRGKSVGLPLWKLLGGARPSGVPAYVSGLPGKNIGERAETARIWASRGATHFKFALPAATDGIGMEMAALREALGARSEIAADLHWRDSAGAALQLIREMAVHRPWFAEAPCKPEDVEGLRRVAAATDIPIAVGEEWGDSCDAVSRVAAGADILQPEMGHLGVTEFARIAALARAHGRRIAPHATLGMGIFLAASVQAASALGAEAHEFQHSVFCPEFLRGGPACDGKWYTFDADAPGIGAEPSEEGRSRLQKFSAGRPRLR